MSLIDIAYTTLHIEAERVQYWVRLVLDVEEKLKGWRKSDRERYRDIREQQDGSAPTGV